MAMEKAATQITHRFVVSEGDRTLQAFDFMSQALQWFLDDDSVDRLQLCQLIETLARSKEWQSRDSIGQLVELAKPLDTPTPRV